MYAAAAASVGRLQGHLIDKIFRTKSRDRLGHGSNGATLGRLPYAYISSVSVEMEMLQLLTIEKLHDPGRLVEM